jgi:hypothetical protein
MPSWSIVQRIQFNQQMELYWFLWLSNYSPPTASPPKIATNVVISAIGKPSRKLFWLQYYPTELRAIITSELSPGEQNVRKAASHCSVRCSVRHIYWNNANTSYLIHPHQNARPESSVYCLLISCMQELQILYIKHSDQNKHMSHFWHNQLHDAGMVFSLPPPPHGYTAWSEPWPALL